MGFFNTVSTTIDDDAYFEMYIQNTFKLLQGSPKKHVYAGGCGGRQGFSPHDGYIQDFHRHLYNGGTVSGNAPFGTMETPMDWSTSLRPNMSRGYNDQQIRGFEKQNAAG